MILNETARALREQAEKIVDRAANTGAVIGVFVVGGRLKATKTSTDVFRQGCRDKADRLVGCYNGAADPMQIVEDALATCSTWPNKDMPKAA